MVLRCSYVLLLIFGVFQVMANTQPAAEASEPSSVLWRVSGGGLEQTSYLFGGWHLLCRNEIVFKHKVKVAISQSEQLLLQSFVTYLTHEDYFGQQDEYEKINRGLPIYKIDDRKKRKHLLKLIKQHMDLKVDHARRIKYNVKRMTALEVFLASMHSFIKDCGGLGSFEALLFDHFSKQKAPIGAVNERKDMLESWLASGFMQVDSLIAYLEGIESQRALVKQMKLAYYVDEDLAALQQLHRIFLSNDHASVEQINQHVFAVNTDDWVTKISHWMATKPTFVVVNANYLIGETGVIAGLRRQGYVVEPVL